LFNKDKRKCTFSVSQTNPDLDAEGQVIFFERRRIPASLFIRRPWWRYTTGFPVLVPGRVFC
jgi:hypothetical protein